MSGERILVSQSTDMWAGAREHMDIVRELAERGPFTDGVGGCRFCRYDARRYDYGDAAFEASANHEPSCLWRRARVLYPGTV